jgi:hypothetical protein
MNLTRDSKKNEQLKIEPFSKPALRFRTTSPFSKPPEPKRETGTATAQRPAFATYREKCAQIIRKNRQIAKIT